MRQGLRVLGFCEGARSDSGGMGLSGVPMIHGALARRGCRGALAIGGHPMPSARHMLCGHIAEVFDPSAADGKVGVVSFPAVGRWCFSPSLYGAAASAAARANFIMLHSVFSFPVYAGYRLARRFRKPYGIWPHGVFAPVQRERAKLKKAVYGAALISNMLREASVLFFSAEGEREETRALGFAAPSVVIPHGIDVAEFESPPSRGQFRAKYLAGDQGFMVLYLGRLNAKKGLDLLIEAFSQAVRETPNVRLVIAGGSDPPSFEERVRGWIKAAGIEDVTILTGNVDEHDKLAAFADCDLFVLPSAAENFGFAMFEAMASQRPVVCSDSLNFAMEVRLHGAGVAVPRTSQAMATAITALLRDPARRQLMGRNGKALAKRYSWETCGSLLETAIRCILAGRPFPAELKPA